MAKKKSKLMYQPMRVQVRKGSLAEKHYYNSALPSGPWPMPKAIAPGISPAPLDDLIFHGGKIVAQMEFQNVFLGSAANWAQSDIASIDAAITMAMRDKRLNNVMIQYFHNQTLSCDPRPLLLLNDPKPAKLGEQDVQNKIAALFDAGKISKSDLDSTIFNLILPPGSVLSLGNSSSLNGLGGYHGSVHIKRGGKNITLYYSANVFSQMLSSNRENGIVAFNANWKNVVATLYHEMNEFRTDADVNDAIQSGKDDFLGYMSRDGEEVGDQPIRVADALNLVFKEVASSSGSKKMPVQFLYSNAVHGAEGPISKPHA
ncbi:MAG TPA: hypothetical protein VMT89_00615 [Candidatus Acidoferrales bacterium]|nr:hypothetical protein [Candidatus Acidoferrales bacterium]